MAHQTALRIIVWYVNLTNNYSRRLSRDTKRIGWPTRTKLWLCTVRWYALNRDYTIHAYYIERARIYFIKEIRSSRNLIYPQYAYAQPKKPYNNMLNMYHVVFNVQWLEHHNRWWCTRNIRNERNKNYSKPQKVFAELFQVAKNQQQNGRFIHTTLLHIISTPDTGRPYGNVKYYIELLYTDGILFESLKLISLENREF